MSYLKRHTPIGRNAKRSRAQHERNFGTRADAVRAMACLCAAYCADVFYNELEQLHAAGRPEAFDVNDPARPACVGPVQACHVIARGMGGAKGDRRQLVPLCAGHHDEAGEGSWKPEQPSKRAAFEARYGLELKAEAERIAIELDAPGAA